MDEKDLFSTTPAAPEQENPAAVPAASSTDFGFAAPTMPFGANAPAAPQAPAAPAAPVAAAPAAEAASDTEAAADEALHAASAAADAAFAGDTAPAANAAAPQPDATFAAYTSPAPEAGAAASFSAPNTAPQYAPVGQQGYTTPAQQPVPGYGTPDGYNAAQQPVPGYGTPAGYNAPNYTQPVPGYGTPADYAGRQPGSGAATASMVLGIVSLVFCLFGEGALVSVVCGIIGLVMASNAKKEGNVSTTRTAGFVMSLIGVIGGALVFVSCAACMGILGMAGY